MFEPLLAYLRGLGAAETPQAADPVGAAEVVLARFGAYLAGRAADGGLDLDSLTAEQVAAFVVRQARLRPGSLPPTVTALRSLLRFLHVDGAVSAGLADAVPTARTQRLAGLPRALAAEQVGAMLATCDQATATGHRNLAI